jgi:hypothetical protein
VFGLAAIFAASSLALALLVPRHPDIGAETVLTRAPAPTQPAE